MIENLRQTGLGVVGDIPWGTHVCYFYETKQELLDTLIPYLKAGLDNNEFCLWLISDPLSEAEARDALRAAVPGFDRHLSAGDIEIVSEANSDLSCGTCDLQRVVDGWKERVDQALAKGYAGVRVTGHPGWLAKNEWKYRVAYEKALDGSICDWRMTALCTYGLNVCAGPRVLDALCTHQLALAQRHGEMEVVETSNTRRASLEVERRNGELGGRVIESTTELALREAERKYREIFENAGEGIFQTTPDGRHITANPALARMLGFDSPEELVRVRTDIASQHYVDPQRRDEFKRLLEEHGSVRGFEYQGYRKDGRKIWSSDSVRAVRDESGTILYYEGIAEDITERKQAEIRSAAFATLAQKLSGARIPADAARIIVDAAHELLGWDACTLHLYDADQGLVYPVLNIDTINGQRVDLTLSAAAEAPSLRARQVIDQGATLILREEPYEFDAYSVPFGDISRPSASIMCVPMRRASTVVGLLSIQSYTPLAYDDAALNDLQALADYCGEALNRIRAEVSLYESEERFRQLSEAAFEAIIIHDQGTILEVNQSFCRMYGYERAEMIGKSVLDLALPEFRELLLQKVRSGDTGSYEGLALRKDGTIFRAELAGKPINYQGRTVRVAAIRDITEQKRNERRQAAQYAVTRVLAESATLAEATPQLLRVICESLRWKMGEFWRVCDSTNLLRCVDTWHVPALDATSFIEASRQTGFAPGVGLPGRVWQSGQPEWIPDVMTGPGFARAAIAGNLGLRGAVALPILLGNHTLGLMLFFSRRIPEVDEDLLKMMSAIGSQIGQFTERKWAEEALLGSERKYRDIFAFAPVGIYQSLRDGTLITANKALAEMLGYASVDELLRVKLGSGVYFAEDKREKLIMDYEGLGYAADLDMQWRRKDGSPICVQLSAHAIKGPNGETEYFEGFVRDITERRLQEEALHESETMLKQSQRVAVLGHYVFDVATGFWTSSAVLDEIFGIDVAYTKNVEGWSNIVHPEQRDEMYAYLRDHVLKERNSFDREYRTVRINDGAVRWVHGLGNLEFNTDGQLARLFGVIQDITERKQIEETLRESEERYRDLVEHSRDLICTHDLEGRLLSVNRAAEKLLGYDLKGLREKNFREILAPEVRDQFDDYLARIREHGVASGTMLLQTSTGEPRVWEYHNTLRTDGVDKPIVRGTAHDITEQRHAEKAMSDLRRELELTMNSMEEGVHRVDLKGNIVFENPAAARMLGWEVDELLGKPAHLTMHHTRPDGTPYPKEECPIFATLRDGLTRQVADEVFWRRDGTTFPVEYTTAPMRNDRNEIVAVVVTFSDITERKRAEAALRESEERYRELFENARDVIYVHDLNGRYTSVNRAAERLSGYTRAELLGKDFSNFLTPESVAHIQASVNKKLRTEDQTRYEVELVAKDGRRVPVEVSSRLIYQNGVAVGVQGSGRDITERKQAEETLRTYSRRLIEAQEAERQRIARELHDQIGQVLTAVQINLHSVQRVCSTPEASARVKESIRVLDEALVQVRDLSLDLRPSLLDDLGLVTALRWYVARQAQRTGVRAEVVTGVPDHVRFSRELETACFRIAQEALTNVARHAQAQRVWVRLHRDGTDLLMTIKDDGVGFDVNTLRKRAPSAATLGLQGMEERAYAVGARIEIDSTTSKGTEIRCRYPIEAWKGTATAVKIEAGGG